VVWWRRGFMVVGIAALGAHELRAQQDGGAASAGTGFFQMFGHGNLVGSAIVILILLLSIALVALVIEHLITIRRGALIPPGLADQVHRMLNQGQVAQSEQLCKERPSFLAYVLQAGLAEVRFGYAVVEKAMEDASQEQAARLMRKIEYLAVIGNIAPMLGLLGTVWGMLMAFGDVPQEVASRTEALAQDISVALWTTVLGLMVAIPALTSFAIFRNRVDHLAAESTLMAEQVFAQLKRGRAARKVAAQADTATPAGGTTPAAVQRVVGVKDK
jgi:biopolymer transport protein ExbB